ncbi:MAG: polysaccharide deacetylase family protein [Aurantibacter sp.]
MRRFFTLLCISCFFTSWIFAQQKTVAARLGYPADAKLLIIHADDLGVAHSENMASIMALEESPVNSASIMVPCPWFPEIAAYALGHSTADLGLHLTLTSEWKYYKWGPVTSKDSVTSLVNNEGYFYDLVHKVAEHADPKHVEIELRNQVKKALLTGIDVTHLDTHMGTVFATPEFAEAYIKIGHEFRLPVLMTIESGEIPPAYAKVFEMLNDKDVVVDQLITAGPEDFERGMEQFYIKSLNELEPGLNCLLIHLAYDDEEMQGVTIDHPEWGAAWRQADFDFFTSPECEKLLKDNNIVLVTWRELRDKITRAK